MAHGCKLASDLGYRVHPALCGEAIIPASLIEQRKENPACSQTTKQASMLGQRAQAGLEVFTSAHLKGGLLMLPRDVLLQGCLAHGADKCCAADAALLQNENRLR